MRGVVEEAESLADTIAIDEIGRHAVLRVQAASVAERERRAFDRAAARAPDVDLGEAVPQQVFCLFRNMVADAAWRGFEAVVVVNLLGHSARALFSAFREHWIAHDVIENHHALGASYPLQQSLDFGIVNR